MPKPRAATGDHGCRCYAFRVLAPPKHVGEHVESAILFSIQLLHLAALQ